MNPALVINADIRVLAAYFHEGKLRKFSEIPEVRRSNWFLVYSYEGPFSYMLNHQEYTAEEGTALLVKPFESFKKMTFEGHYCLLCEFFFSAEAINSSPPAFLVKLDRHFANQVEQFHDLLREKTNPLEVKTYQPDIKLSFLIRSIILSVFLQVDPKYFQDSPDSAKFNHIIFDYLVNQRKDLSIKEMARQMKMSRSEFVTFVRNLTGLPPHYLITKLRNGKAWNLLTRSDYSIDDIAEILGFSDRYAFSKSFKNINHIGPSKARENKKQYSQLDNLPI